MNLKSISQNTVGGRKYSLPLDHILLASEWTFLTYTHRDAGGDRYLLTTHRMLSKLLFLHFISCEASFKAYKT